MRVLCDQDDHDAIKLLYHLFKGTIIFGRFPYLTRKTKRGFHYGWRFLDLTKEESCKYRLKLGDDPKRIMLDLTCPKKPFQVLFSDKKVYVYEYDFLGNIIGKKKVQ
jgi:hypothetical protein